MYQYGRLIEGYGCITFWTMENNERIDRSWRTFGFIEIMNLLSKEGWDVVCSANNVQLGNSVQEYILRKEISK